MSKARFAPIKLTSIPWLELLELLVLDLDQHVKSHLEIPISKSFLWMDSTVLYFSTTTMNINGFRIFLWE